MEQAVVPDTHIKEVMDMLNQCKCRDELIEHINMIYEGSNLIFS